MMVWQAAPPLAYQWLNHELGLYPPVGAFLRAPGRGKGGRVGEGIGDLGYGRWEGDAGGAREGVWT